MASYNTSSSSSKDFFVCLVLAIVLCVQGALGSITCERLDRNTCAFAVSSSGTRCVLEKRARRGGREEYTCRSSQIEAENLTDWIETDECVEACGLDRDSLGISSDSLVDSHFARKLCSPRCYQSCPNIVDLYFNLAAGEGVFLPSMCQMQAANARRGMAEIRSSGVIATGPVSATPGRLLASAPTQPANLLSFDAALPPL